MASETVKTKDFELEARAKAAWRDYCRNPTDVDSAFGWFSREFPGIRPDNFEDNGHARERKASNAIRGDVGRLRHLVGESLERRRIDFGELAELESLATDIFGQFEPGIVGTAFDALTRCTSGPYWAAIERGKERGRNHFHWFGKKGSCKLGVSNGIVPDEELLDRVAYVYKSLCWQDEVVVGFLSVKQAYPGQRVASRYGGRGLRGRRNADALLIRHILTRGFWPKQFTSADALFREIEPDCFEVSTLGAL